MASRLGRGDLQSAARLSQCLVAGETSCACSPNTPFPRAALCFSYRKFFALTQKGMGSTSAPTIFRRMGSRMSSLSEGQDGKKLSVLKE